MSKINFVLILKGIVIGVANIIPGVSGGTIALITRVYTPLITCLKRLNIKSLKMLLGLKFKDFSNYTNFSFLFFCVLGVLIGVVVYTSFLTNVLKITPDGDPVPQLMGFFFGLILASIFYVFKRINTFNAFNAFILIVGIAIAVLLYFLSISSTGSGDNNSYLNIFLSGIVGVCGMILPGLSGSFILLIMDNYFVITTAVDKTKKFILNNNEFMIEDINYVYILLVFLGGTLTGLLLFSNIIYWFYNKFYNSTLSLLTGFIIGSLLMIWPWVNTDSKIYLPVELSLNNITIILCIFIGILSIYILEKVSTSHD